MSPGKGAAARRDAAADPAAPDTTLPSVALRTVVRFTLEGHPITQGSKNPVVPTYKDGEPVRRHRDDCPLGGGRSVGCGCPVLVNVIEDNAKELAAWREAVGLTARAAMSGEPRDGLLVAGMTFFLKRPKSHYGSGTNARVLRRSAPAMPGVKPDTGKLARAVEDALTGIVYTDDARLVNTYHGKRYVHQWEPERVEVIVAACLFQTVGDLMDARLMPTPEEEMGQLGLLDALAS